MRVRICRYADVSVPVHPAGTPSTAASLQVMLVLQINEMSSGAAAEIWSLVVTLKKKVQKLWKQEVAQTAFLLLLWVTWSDVQL